MKRWYSRDWTDYEAVKGYETIEDDKTVKDCEAAKLIACKPVM